MCGGHDHEHHHEHGHEEKKTIKVMRKALETNEVYAERNRGIFDFAKVLSINLMGSPGAGKTTLIEYLIDVLPLKIGVVEGDLETENDADRVRAKGAYAYQIRTSKWGGTCHLEAPWVNEALKEIPLNDIDVLFVEDVGNLVCPASFELGTHYKWVMVSTTEGEDKPIKYPKMFNIADVVIISKVDIADAVGADVEKMKEYVRQVNGHAKIFTFGKSEADAKEIADYIVNIRKDLFGE